ncbi:MAG: protein kinase domain-containing protein, partial [Bryobacteraceae bacterium]
MPFPAKVKDRYETKEIIGRGGMGLVYKAYDTVVGRDVALKTIGDVQGRAALELFYREWRVLANMHHPNIIEIFDIGEFEEDGTVKPFFVMPLLRGTTLDQVIRTPGGPQLTVEWLSEIMLQVCRGLQAAHEHGLVHRDIKPSNIFVMEYNSVKLIDFGVAHLMDGRSATGLKGTVWYMAPEQIQNMECTPASDIFSLGVVCYEALTGTRPFQGSRSEEIFEAILNHIPVPACDLNPGVSLAVSRVIHKAMAKQPRHRFSSAPEFGETLQKAVRNEPIEFFDPARIEPRIERAKRAFEAGNYQLARDIMSDLEAAGHIDTAVTPLRRQVDQAIRRKTVLELLDRARTGWEEEEYTLALQSVDQLLKLEPGNEEALALKAQIQESLRNRQIEDLFDSAGIYLRGRSYGRARQALHKILEMRPGDGAALELAAEVDRQEQAYRAARLEKDQLYQQARDAWKNFEFAAAGAKMERVLELEERAPDTSAPDSRSNYLSFFDQIRAAQEFIERSHQEAAGCIERGDHGRLAEICNQALARYPEHPLFIALRLDWEERLRQQTLMAMADYAGRASTEPELERKTALLKQATETFPGEPHFDQWLRWSRERLNLVRRLVAKAQAHEKEGRLLEALDRWRTVQVIEPGRPGIEGEVGRLETLTGDSGKAVRETPSPPAAQVSSPTPPTNAAPGTGTQEQTPQVSTPQGSTPQATAPEASAPQSTGIPAPDAPPTATRVASPPKTTPPRAEPSQPEKPAAPERQERSAPVRKEVPAPKRRGQSVSMLLNVLLNRASTLLSVYGADAKKLLLRARSIRLPQPNLPQPKMSRWVWGTAAAVLFLVIAALMASRKPEAPEQAAGPKGVPVVLRAEVPGTIIRVNGQQKGIANPELKLSLPPGTYEVEARRDGYRPVFDALVVRAGSTASLNVPAMDPLPPAVRLLSDFDRGRVWMDGQPAEDLRDAQFTRENLPEGSHNVKISDFRNEVSIAFDVKAGQPPAISSL